MNENQKRGLVFTTSLILIILVIIYLNMMIFISGPHIYDDNTSEIKSAVKTALDVDQIELVNKYILDEVVYVFEVTKGEESQLVFFADNMVHKQVPSDTFNEEELNIYLEENYRDDYEIMLGYYDDKPIIALVNDNEEVILDYYSYEQLFVWNKGV